MVVLENTYNGHRRGWQLSQSVQRTITKYHKPISLKNPETYFSVLGAGVSKSR